MENLLSGRLGYVSPLATRSLRTLPAGRHRRRRSSCSTPSASPDSRTTRADALSGGQRQRVGIARARDAAAARCCSPTSRPPRSIPKTSVEIMQLDARSGPRQRDIPVHRQHARRRARPALRRPHRRHVGRAASSTTAPPAALGDEHAEVDLRRRGMAALSAAPAGAVRARPVPHWLGRASRWLALAAYVVYACAAARFHLGALHDRPGQRRAVHRPHVSAEFLALGAPAQGPHREPARSRCSPRLSASCSSLPIGLARRAQPDAGVGDVAGARADRAVPLVPSGDRRHRVRQGGRLRRAGGDRSR